MQPHAGIGLGCGRRRRIPFRILVREHQDGVADPDLGVHHPSVRSKAEAHDFGAESAMVKVGGCLGIFDDNMRGEGVKAFGDGCNAHEKRSLSTPNLVARWELSATTSPRQQNSHISAHSGVEPTGLVEFRRIHVRPMVTASWILGWLSGKFLM